MKTFEEAWADKEAEGYNYGEDALENVSFGYHIALESQPEVRVFTAPRGVMFSIGTQSFTLINTAIDSDPEEDLFHQSWMAVQLYKALSNLTPNVKASWLDTDHEGSSK